jgi:hypothetical protein
MTIIKDNTFGNYVAITPIKVNYMDNADATRLYVKSTDDDLSTKATFSYTLRDEQRKIKLSGAITIQGTDYTDWPGDNSTPFSYVAGKISVVIVS